MPFVAMTGAIRPNTPIGDSLMMTPITLMHTSERLSTTAPASLPFSPANMMPNPKNRAITIICSMVALAKGWMALDGNMFTIVSMNDGVSATPSNAYSDSEDRLYPLPTLSTLAITSPNVTANAVVHI